jgi:hypothetical protein
MLEFPRVSGCERKHDSAQPSIRMIRHYAAMGLQLLGLILTGEALLLYFGQMGPLMKTASLGAGLFYAGRFLQTRSLKKSRSHQWKVR